MRFLCTSHWGCFLSSVSIPIFQTNSVTCGKQRYKFLCHHTRWKQARRQILKLRHSFRVYAKTVTSEQESNETNKSWNITISNITKQFQEIGQRLGFTDNDIETLSNSLLSSLGIQKTDTQNLLGATKKEKLNIAAMVLLAGYAFESYNEPKPIYCEEMTENCFVAFVSDRLLSLLGDGMAALEVKQLSGFPLEKVKGLRMCSGSRVARFQNILSLQNIPNEKKDTKRKQRSLFKLVEESFTSDPSSCVLFGCLLAKDFFKESTTEQVVSSATSPLVVQFCTDIQATKESVWAQADIHWSPQLETKQMIAIPIRSIAFVGIPFFLRNIFFQMLRWILEYVPKLKEWYPKPFHQLRKYAKPRVVGMAEAELYYQSCNMTSNNKHAWQSLLTKIYNYQRQASMAYEKQQQVQFRMEESNKWLQYASVLPLKANNIQTFQQTELVCMIENLETDTEVLIWQQKNAPIIYVAFRGTEQNSWQDFVTDALLYQQPYFFGEEDVDMTIVSSPEETLQEMWNQVEKHKEYFGFHQTTSKEDKMEEQKTEQHREAEEKKKIEKLVEENLVCYYEGPKVHYGFLRSFMGIRNTFVHVIERLVSSCDVSQGTEKIISPMIYMTGHSLGGALATLAAGELAFRHRDWNIHMYNFGSPRVGNAEFANQYNQLVPHSFRIVNDTDIIARIPRSHNFEYFHVGRTVLINQKGEIWIQGQSGEEDPLDDTWSSLQEMLEAEWSLLQSLSKGSSLEHHLEAAYLAAMGQILKKQNLSFS